MTLEPGWRETQSGLAVPADALRDRDIWTPEFRAFMRAIDEHLPEVQEWVAKSLAARGPQTQPAPFYHFLSSYSGIKEPFATAGLSHETLRTMAYRCPITSAIVSTRIDQVAAFCQLPESKSDAGFRIALRDPELQPDRDDRREMRELEDFILECGLPEANEIRPPLTFEQFIRSVLRDSLELDALAFEVIPGANAEKYPCVGLMPVDAAQIRLTQPEQYHPKRSGVRNIFAVQMQHGQITAEYTAEELAYGVRNPCTNVMRAGYGTSEQEWTLHIITSILFGIAYNENYFTGSAIPPGVLSISGNLSPEMLEGFRQQWQAQVGGPGNWFKTPVINTRDGAGVSYVKFRDSNKDMEFHQLLAFYITILCANYRMHPEEIGMQSWAPYRTTLNEANPITRIQSSQDRGLKPILKLIAQLINSKVIWRLYPDRKYVFEFVNINEIDEERELRMRRERLEAGLSLPEHEIADMDGKQHPYAKVPINPYMFQAWQMQNSMESQPERDNNTDKPEGDEKKGEDGENDESAPRLLGLHKSGNVVEVEVDDY